MYIRKTFFSAKIAIFTLSCSALFGSASGMGSAEYMGKILQCTQTLEMAKGK